MFSPIIVIIYFSRTLVNDIIFHQIAWGYFLLFFLLTIWINVRTINVITNESIMKKIKMKTPPNRLGLFDIIFLFTLTSLMIYVFKYNDTNCFSLILFGLMIQELIMDRVLLYGSIGQNE